MAPSKFWWSAFYEPVYGSNIFIGVGPQDEFVAFWFERYRDEFPKRTDYGIHVAGTRLSADGTDGMHVVHRPLQVNDRTQSVDRWIWMRDYTADADSIGTLAHESLHCAMQILRERSFTDYEPQKSDEPLCYLHEYIIEECLRRIVRQRAKTKRKP